VAGTFLVAAIDQTAPGWVGSGAWVLPGLAAVPSSALWAWLAGTWSRPTLLAAALVVQAVGIALPVARTALLIGAAVVAAAALAAGVLRHRFPHHLGPLPGRVRAAGERIQSGGAPFNVGEPRRPSTGAPT
jgi:hypothetical protein